MHDWRESKTRYLIHFQGAGGGMRYRDVPLSVGNIVEDCGESFAITRVEQPGNPRAFGHAWAELLGDA